MNALSNCRGILILTLAACASIADAKDEPAAQCEWADLFDPVHKDFVDAGGRYMCQVYRDDPCEVWSLDAMAICKSTVRLSYHRLGKELLVVVLDRNTAAVLSP
jgi:hypothetical protein